MHYTDHSKLTCESFNIPMDQHHQFHKIHQFIDNTKKYFWHTSHRALLHTLDYGQAIVVKKFHHVVFGIPTNEIFVQHITDDFDNFKPNLKDFLENINLDAWVNSQIEYQKFVKLKTILAQRETEYTRYILNAVNMTGLPHAAVLPCSLFGVEHFSQSLLKNNKYLTFLVDNEILFDIRLFLHALDLKPWARRVNQTQLRILKDINGNHNRHTETS